MTRATPSRRCPRLRPHAGVALTLVFPAVAIPAPTAAQFTEPCAVACALVLGATAVTAGTGVAVALGRRTGGVSTASEGLVLWGAGFTLVTGAGVALSGNGERQRRGVYAAGIGSLVGSLLWLGIEAAFDESDGPRKLAALLMGAAGGALLGGVYGAASYEGSDSSGSVPLLTLTVPF